MFFLYYKEHFLKLKKKLKNEGDRFIVIYLVSEKIDPKKTAIHTFILDFFFNYNIPTVKQE